MKVETREGGDGVLCWNVEAITQYAAEVTRREVELNGTNPDLVVMPGRLLCYGCEVLEYDLGTRCTAVLTKTLYAVRGEIAPRAEDAAGFLSEIPGMETRIDAQPAATVTVTASAAPEQRQAKPKGLFRRRT